MTDLARNETSRRDFLRISGLTALAAGGSWTLTGCGIFDDGSGGGGSDGGSDAAQELTIDFVPVETLDPQVITNGMWILLRGISEGLVVQNETSDDVLPGMAEEWTISDDQLTYTFKIRDDAKWSDDSPLTAEDFERSYKRLFTPAGTSAGGTTLGANSYQVSTGIKGAPEFLAGALKDWAEVGVKATGERELTLTLAIPNPDFLLSLTHPAMLPIPMDLVENKPDDWQKAGTFISNGPFAVTAWKQNSSITLVRNEHYWDADNVSLEKVTVRLIEPTTAATGTVGYENNETDIMGIAEPSDILRFQEDPEHSDELVETETYSILYLGKMRGQNPALEDVRVRKALSLALGREQLAGVQPGARPGVSLVTDRVEGWDDSIAIQENLDEAKQLLADAGYPDGKGLPPVRILIGTPTTTLADAIVDIWQKNLGIKAQLDHVEAGVYTERRWAVQKGDYIGFYYGTFAGLPTWATMVGTLWSPTDIQKFSLPAAKWDEYQKIELDEKMDAATKTSKLQAIIASDASDGSKQMGDIVGQAQAEVDEGKQTDLYKQAAKLREDEFLFLPVLWLSNFHLVKPKVQNVQMRAYPDFYYLKPISISDEA